MITFTMVNDKKVQDKMIKFNLFKSTVKNWVFWLLAFWGVLCICLGSFFWTMDANSTPIVLLILGPILICELPLISYLKTKAYFKKEAYKVEIHLDQSTLNSKRLDKTGVLISQSIIPISSVRIINETNEVFILSIKPLNTQSLITKESFQSPEDIDKFREILTPKQLK